MNSDDAERVFRELVANPAALVKGKEILEAQLAKVDTFAARTIELLVNPAVEARFRVYVGALIRNPLKEAWSTIPLLESQKNPIREMLIEGLVLNYTSLPLIDAISLIIADLIIDEGPPIWENAVRELTNWLTVEEEDQNQACLEALCNIVVSSDNRISIFVPYIMPHLFPLISRAEATPKLREKVLVLLYLAISSFSWAEDSDASVVAKCFDETYDLWMSFFLSALQTSPKSHISLKRYILKILTIIFRDLPRYSKKSLGPAVNVIWKFLNQNLPLYVWSVIYDVPIENITDDLQLSDPSMIGQGKTASRISANAKEKEANSAGGFKYAGFELEEEQDYDNDVELIAIQLIELITTLLGKPILRDVVRVGVYPLINSLCHYMLMTSYDEHLWLHEPNQFINNEEDESNMRSIRNSGLKLISELINSYEDDTLPVLMLIVDKFLQGDDEDTAVAHLRAVIDEFAANGGQGRDVAGLNIDRDYLLEAARTSTFNVESQIHVWKKRETGLLILGAFAEDIVVYQARSNENFDLTRLISNVVRDLEAKETLPVLRGRALWCISRFSEVISLKHKDLSFRSSPFQSKASTPASLFPFDSPRARVSQAMPTRSRSMVFWQKILLQKSSIRSRGPNL
eukprot:TRINITY_DN6546_c0_g2_i5.p1 TRINITY_DN6546_c0_g2~~TRINITY_DN6546_c0_g2_i5.p1  ORF type:complete len:631 (-),score=169.14 TRINITY_DN6546_c0_g2_i5:1645-3537(-)